MGLTFDVLPSCATSLVVALTRAGGTLLVRAERLMGVALIPVDTSRTLNCMATIVSKHRKIKCRGRLRYCLEEQVDENHLHPTAWYQELKVTGLSKGDIEARYNLR
jgi:hypothetical protein